MVFMRRPKGDRYGGSLRTRWEAPTPVPTVDVVKIAKAVWNLTAEIAELPYVQREAIARALRDRLREPDSIGTGPNKIVFKNLIIGISEVVK